MAMLIMVELEIENGQTSAGGMAASREHAFSGEPPTVRVGWVAVIGACISGYAGKNSNDPEWIMQDPDGLPDMEKGGHKQSAFGA